MTSAEKHVMPDLCHRRNPFHFVTALVLLRTLGVNLTKVHLRAVGEYRNYRGEILDQAPAPGAALTGTTEISLDVGFYSAVDHMPYQFFYGIQGVTSRSDKWDEDARSLMAPFDGSVIRFQAEATYESLKFILTSVNYEHLVKQLQLFDFDAATYAGDLGEAVFWSSILPYFHFWAGNPEVVARTLTYLFGYRFEIRENIEAGTDIPDALQSRLGQKFNRMGSEFVLGKTYSDYDSCYEVRVCGVPSEETGNWLPGKTQRERLERMLQYCMPAEYQYQIRVMVDGRKNRLGKQQKEAYLGMSAYVS